MFDCWNVLSLLSPWGVFFTFATPALLVICLWKLMVAIYESGEFHQNHLKWKKDFEKKQEEYNKKYKD